MTPERHFVTPDGVQLDYALYGDPSAPPVLLLHGLGADRDMWWPQLERWPAEGFFLIAPDLRGHGRSQLVDPFRIADCARDLDTLLEELGVRRAAAVGVSMGGLVAQQLAVDFPDRVSRMVIADSFSGVSGPLWTVNRWLSQAMLRLPRAWLVASLKSAYPKAAHAPAREYLQGRMRAMDGEAIRRERAEVNRFDLRHRLNEVRAPTLVLVGDLFGRVARTMAEETARGIPDARFEVIPGGGDPSNLLVPEAFSQKVLTFLRE